MDKRIAGIVMFLPCIDGAWDRNLWGEELWARVQNDRFSAKGDASIKFWPLTDGEAAGKEGSVLSGDYVRDWSVVAGTMASQAKNAFSGRLTLQSFWKDFNCRPMDVFDRIAPTPVLWIMASNDVVCGPLEFTKGFMRSFRARKNCAYWRASICRSISTLGFPSRLTR